MGDTIFWRLVWKEYRAQRGFWLSVAGAAFALQLLSLTLVDRSAERMTGLFVIALVLPVCYVLGCSCVLFAGEKEEGTIERLRILAAPSGRLFFSKLGFTVVSTLLMFGMLCLPAWLSSLSQQLRYSVPGQGFFLGLEGAGLFTAGFLVWGIFFSILSKRVLTAVVMTATIPIVFMILWDMVLREKFDDSWAIPLTILSTMLVINYWLARRWMLGKLPLYNRAADWSVLSLLKRRHVSLAERVAGGDMAPPERRALKRLLWQEWRQSLSFVRVYFVIGLCLFVIVLGLVIKGVRRDSDDFVAAISFLFIAMTPLLMGVWTFRAEQESHHFRFLSERGIAPKAIWLNKHKVWLTWMLVITALFVLAIIFVIPDLSRGSSGKFEFSKMWSFAGFMGPIAILYCCTAYSVGQLVSMLIPRAVTAGFIGFMVTVLLAGWIGFMHWLQVPLLLSVAPIPVIFMVATFLRTSGWLLERNSWQAWSRVAATLVLPGCLMLGAIAVYRVHEIPADGPGFSVDEFLKPVTAAQTKTADMYRQAGANITAWPRREQSFDEDAVPKTVQDGWEFATEAERRWLQENQEALQLVLAATRREQCAFRDPATAKYDSSSYFDFDREVITLLQFSARKLESEDRLDDALEYYLATLRFGRHQAVPGDPSNYSSAHYERSETYEWLLPWAAHAKQTPQLLLRAIREIEQEAALMPSFADALKFEHVALRRTLLENRTALWEDEFAEKTVDWIALSVYGRYFLWERARELRVLDALTADKLATVAAVEQGLRYNTAGFISLIEQTISRTQESFSRPPWKWAKSTPIIFHSVGPQLWVSHYIDIVNSVARQRMVVLMLALVAWRHEHGKFPDQLDALVGTYFDTLPLDPWNRRNFSSWKFCTNQ